MRIKLKVACNTELKLHHILFVPHNGEVWTTEVVFLSPKLVHDGLFGWSRTQFEVRSSFGGDPALFLCDAQMWLCACVCVCASLLSSL